MTSILLIGAADTGRAPMAAALLRRLLDQRGYGWSVGSAGVLGHDGDPAEIEARDTMTHMGLSVDDHQARSLTDDLVASAALILAIDSGTATALRARFPAAVACTHTLGALAGRQRDIPDPFRMQIGAWITYAREITGLLEAALPRIVQLMPATTPSAGLRAGDRPFGSAVPEPVEGQGRRPTTDEASFGGQRPGTQRVPSGQRAAAAERIERLLRTIADMPGVVEWAAARERIEADLSAIAAAPRDGGDLAAAYVGLLRAALAMTAAAPSPGQVEALRAAAGRLVDPIEQAQLNELSAQLARWLSL